MKKYLIDSSVGFALGIFYFFGSALLDVEFLDTPLHLRLRLADPWDILVSGTVYIFVAIIPFLLYVNFPFYKNRYNYKKTGFKNFLLPFLWFAGGIYFAFLAFFLFAGFAFSLTTGPF